MAAITVDNDLALSDEMAQNKDEKIVQEGDTTATKKKKKKKKKKKRE